MFLKSVSRWSLAPAVVLSVLTSAYAGDISERANGPWLMFAFGAAGSDAYSCVDLCVPFGNAVQADTPPWTFVVGPRGATVSVVDAFTTGDVFEVFDNGALLGETSDAPTGGFCGASAESCLNTTA